MLALRKEKAFVDELNAGDVGVVILDKTNFYAEQGGQSFDRGVLTKLDSEVNIDSLKNICNLF